MSNTEIKLVLQPPRSKSQKRRLARRMRGRGVPEAEIKRVVWHPENSPTKRRGKYEWVKPTSQYWPQMRASYPRIREAKP